LNGIQVPVYTSETSMKKWMFTTAIALSTIIAAMGQSRLAYVYGHDEYNREAQKRHSPEIQLLGDSALIISSAILMNVAPEKYSITFGIAQTGNTPEQALRLINERLTLFQKQLKKMGLPDTDQYVDFISQNKIYDFDLVNNKAIEKETGFEIKKNITIIFDSEPMIEKMTVAAAEQQIFDVIKVEYLLSDYTSFYKQLFAEALKQVKDRKLMYVEATGMELSSKSALNTDDLTIIFPRTQYKRYTAYETGDVSGRYDNYTKKELRKSSTAYYEGISQHGFDKIINNNKPGVFIQLAYAVSIKYYLTRH
jgi:uncharacterized protein YggE